MSDIILDDDYRALGAQHQFYMRNRDRWQFLYESYVGGQEYRNGGHLNRYQLENSAEYQNRLRNTPLSNECQSVIQTYISFLFRTPPERHMEGWEYLPDVEEFLRDCDMEGRDLDSFMKQAAIWSSVFGHSWIIMTKPSVGAETQGQEIALGSRPYLNLITPLVMSDWRWERTINGRYRLVYIKYVEEVVDKITIIKEWTPEIIKTWEMDTYAQRATIRSIEVNELGEIPAIIVYNQRSVVKGVGVSDINDIADLQKMIYNLTSENEQAIRLDGHPSLVVPESAQLGSGAGALIILREGADAGQNPYYLESNGVSVANIHSSIDKLRESIDKISFTGGVRATESRTMSGVAMETEFALLNAKLSEKADNLELAEEQMWELYGLYTNREWQGEIKYPDSFNIRDEQREFTILQQAKAASTDPAVLRVIDEQILEALGEEKERLPFIDPNPQPGRIYPDGEPIADSLPAAYQDSSNPEVPRGQNCGNCEYYKPGELYCTKFDAPVRAVYWCAKWEPVEEYHAS